jgi:PAS domain S-box-containing protein
LLSSLYKSNLARDELETELEKRIEELLLTEEKFSKAFHSNPLAMVLQRENDANYLDVNAAFTEVTGYSRKEAIGNKPGELNLYPTAEEAKRVKQALFEADGRLRNFEFTFQRKSGETGTGLLSSEFFELQGARTLLGIIMDISERKQAEYQIRRLNLEMEKRVVDRSRELSAFLDLAFLVSHQDSLDQIFLPALERILEISSHEVVCIHVYSDDRQYLTLEAQVGLEAFEEDQLCMLVPAGGFASWLRQPKDPLLLSDLKASTILPDPMRPARFGSCLVTQLVVQGEVLGVMSCYRQDVHTFSLEEISLLVAIAEQLGVSLENYRLRLEAEQAAIFTERRRLARDLHDSITQSIYGLTLFTRSSQDALREGNQDKLTANLEQIEENAVLALKEMRLLLYQMQPQGLEGGFAERIEARLDLVERRLGIQATCQIDDQVPLSPEKQDMLFHIALEALNNSLKHAKAKQVHVVLEGINGALVMEILDDGKGFDVRDEADTLKYSGMGLKNMHTRAAELNGQLDIISSPTEGTRVRLSIDAGSVQI